MKKLKTMWLMILVLVVPGLLIGCAGGKTRYEFDKEGNLVGQVEERSFWESENLDRAYEAMTHQTQAIMTLHNSTKYSNNESKVLGGVIAALLVEKVSNMQMPRTMVDLWASITPAIIQAVPNYWMAFGGGDFGRRSGSPSLGDIHDSTIIWESVLGTGAGSQADFIFGTMADFDFETSGESSGSFNGSGMFDNSRSSSQSRSESYVESPRKDDSSLF